LLKVKRFLWSLLGWATRVCFISFPSIQPLLGSVAPIFYLLLQGLLLISLAFTCPTAFDFNNDKFLFVFWYTQIQSSTLTSLRLNVFITITLFFVVHRSDPGHVPVDAVFFTDQEEPPLSASNHQYFSLKNINVLIPR